MSDAPKSRHAWRGFLKEYVIIVIGVATALAAQQGAEALNDRRKATAARASINSEIARNLAYMNVREATEACMGKRLDEVDELIATYARGWAPPETLWIGQPVVFAMMDGNYKAALQSGAVSLFGDGEQAAYANLYAMFEIYWQQSLEELRAWGDLRTLEKHPSPSPVLDWQLRSAMQQARNGRYGVGLTRQVALRDAAGLGVKAAPEEKFPTAPACVPLNTPRDEALKLSARPGFNLRIP